MRWVASAIAIATGACGAKAAPAHDEGEPPVAAIDAAPPLPVLPALGGIQRLGPCEVTVAAADDAERGARAAAFRALLPADATFELSALGDRVGRLTMSLESYPGANVGERALALIAAHRVLFGLSVVQHGRVFAQNAEWGISVHSGDSDGWNDEVSFQVRGGADAATIYEKDGRPPAIRCTTREPAADDPRFAAAVEGTPLDYGDDRGQPQSGGAAHADQVYGAELATIRIMPNAPLRLRRVVHVHVRSTTRRPMTWSIFLDPLSAAVLRVVPDFST
jgi:hypothetical protein